MRQAVAESSGGIGCSWCTDFGYDQAFRLFLDSATVRAGPCWRESDVKDHDHAALDYAEIVAAALAAPICTRAAATRSCGATCGQTADSVGSTQGRKTERPPVFTPCDRCHVEKWSFPTDEGGGRRRSEGVRQQKGQRRGGTWTPGNRTNRSDGRPDIRSTEDLRMGKNRKQVAAQMKRLLGLAVCAE
jgi:hypothetical protein